MSAIIGRRTFTAGALALAASPFAARAQAPGRTYRIAVWHPAFPLEQLAADGAALYRAFFEELVRHGFIEGRNLIVERYSSDGRPERYEATARAIVASKPDLIAVPGTAPARSLLALTREIPIVASSLVDPVALGLVSSLARPGANLTGFTQDGGAGLSALRLQYIVEAVGSGSRFAFLTTQGRLYTPVIADLRTAATGLRVELDIQAMTGDLDTSNYRQIFARLREEGINGLHVSDAVEFFGNRRPIIDLAAEYKIPAIYAFREFVDEGGLMAYGVNNADNYRKAAGYVARILGGEKPNDLPIQQPTKFNLVINQKTAKTIGIEIPFLLLARADEVIE